MSSKLVRNSTPFSFARFAPLAIAAALAGLYVANVRATDATGFTPSTIAFGRFGDIDVATQALREFGDRTPRKDLWLSLQKTKGPSDLYVQTNTWQPGGHTGWHTHPGHSLIIVTEGELTVYDHSCTPTVYTAGNPAAGIPNPGFVDAGGDHVHLIANEGGVVARTIAVQLIPAGATRREGRPAPDGCQVGL